MTKDRKQQYTLRISQANSTELVVILYEMLMDYLEEGRLACKTADTETKKEALRKSRGCINELMQSLNQAYEPAPALMQIYLYCLKRLAHCERKDDEDGFEEISRIIAPLCDAYRQLIPLNEGGPVMNNSQTVYAGLTYGRNTLTENMADQSTNRGMFV